MKKLISTILIFVLCTQLVVFANDTNKEIKTYEREAMILSQLGMLPVELEAYRPYDYITNYDFLKMLATFSKVPFNDSTAYANGLGIIENGAKLENYVYPTYDFAVRAALSVLGFNIKTLPITNDRTWYMSQAKQIGVISSGVSSDECLRYSDAVKLVYDMFDAPVLDTDSISLGKDGFFNVSYVMSKETALYHFQETYPITGIVEATGFTSRYGESSISDGCISIDGVVYNINENVDADKYVGMKCEAYLSEDDATEGIRAVVPDKKVEHITIKAEQFEAYNHSNRKLSYYAGKDDTKRYTEELEQSVAVIVNGFGLESFSESDFAIDDGYINLYDNDSNGRYDLVVIEAARYFVVSSIGDMSRTIYNKITYDTDLKSINVDEREEDNKVCIKKDGKIITLSDIATNEVLEIYYNPKAKRRIINITVSGSTLTGTLNAMDGDYETVKIDNQEYKVSKSYVRAKDKKDKYAPDFKTGNYYRFYLNEDLEIVAADEGELDSVKAGYLFKTFSGEMESVFATAYLLKIFTEDGEWQKYMLAEKVSLNGERRTLAENVYQQIAITDGSRGQFILYKLNKNQEIVELRTAKNGLLDDDKEFDSLGYQNLIYRNSAVPSFDTEYYFSSDCKLFHVPYTYKEEDFEIITRSWFANDTSYEVNLYQVNEFNAAKYILVNGTQTMVNSQVNSGAVMLVSDTSFTLNHDDCVVRQIEGISGFLTKYSVKFSDIALEKRNVNGSYIYTEQHAEINRGDLIRFKTDANGDVRYFEILNKASDREHYKPTGSWKLFTSTAYVKGVVQKVDAETYGIILEINGEKQVIYANANSKILICEGSDGRYSMSSGTIGDIEEDDFLFATTPYGYAQNIVIYKN